MPDPSRTSHQSSRSGEPSDDGASEPMDSSRGSERRVGNQQIGGESVSWMRFSGAGVELALITIAFGAVGAWADCWWNLQRPVCSALAGLVGFTLGMIRFIRLALAASESEADRRRRN